MKPSQKSPTEDSTEARCREAAEIAPNAQLTSRWGELASTWFTIAHLTGWGAEAPQRRPAGAALTKQSYIPLALSVLFIVCLSLYYGKMLPVGAFHLGDEYKTLDRSNAFVVHDDWLTVYWRNTPSFKKPPLQYWLTAVSLNNISNTNVAARLPSYVFGFGVLLATGLLALIINNSNPYSAPAAIVLLSTSALFWEMTVSAMLDTGMVLFCILAVLGTIRALRQPRYWYLVAAAVGLGSLQKAPIAILLVAGILALLLIARDSREISVRSVFANRHFKWAAAMAFLLTASWPVLQTARYGSEAITEPYLSEMAEHFIVGPASSHPWYQVLIGPEGIIWLPAIISTLVIPAVFRRFEAWVPLLIVGGFFLLIANSSGHVTSRYPLLILPFLAASLASLLACLPGRGTVLAVVAGLCFLAGGPLKSAEALGLMSFPQEKYRPFLQKFKDRLRPEETLITCGWKVGAPPPMTTLFDESISYYASKGHRIYNVKSPDDFLKRQLIKKKIKPPYRGICGVSQFEQLKERLVDHEIVDQSEGYVHWISTSGAVSK
jgi:hypothetical protein